MEVAIEERYEQRSDGRCTDHPGSRSLSTYVPREYIRHPNWLPIHYRRIPESGSRLSEQGSTGAGGICFKVRKALMRGAVLEVKLPIWKEVHVFQGIVEWCRAAGRAYEVGLAFGTEADAFRARMVEQICHIETYRKNIMDRDGREMSTESAAREWVEKYAADFPPCPGGRTN